MLNSCLVFADTVVDVPHQASDSEGNYIIIVIHFERIVFSGYIIASQFRLMGKISWIKSNTFIFLCLKGKRTLEPKFLDKPYINFLFKLENLSTLYLQGHLQKLLHSILYFCQLQPKHLQPSHPQP